jgi:hypothetical protein
VAPKRETKQSHPLAAKPRTATTRPHPRSMQTPPTSTQRRPLVQDNPVNHHAQTGTQQYLASTLQLGPSQRPHPSLCICVQSAVMRCEPTGTHTAPTFAHQPRWWKSTRQSDRPRCLLQSCHTKRAAWHAWKTSDESTEKIKSHSDALLKRP